MCWVCVIFFARVVVSERLRWAHRGVRGGAARPPLGGCMGAEPPARGFGGSAPRKNFWADIFSPVSGRHIADILSSGRHISGTTYFWDHMILGGFRHMVFADGFLFPVKELGFWTNPGHWVRVLDAAGSYMYIVL
jgi:hypothetical protein